MEELLPLGASFCDCSETFIRGARLPAPRFHDCDYCRARNTLIPEAEKIADAKVATVPAPEDGGASYAAWTRAFSTAMDELSKPLLNGAQIDTQNK